VAAAGDSIAELPELARELRRVGGARFQEMRRPTATARLRTALSIG
jgi:hypothetical protein